MIDVFSVVYELLVCSYTGLDSETLEMPSAPPHMDLPSIVKHGNEPADKRVEVIYSNSSFHW